MAQRLPMFRPASVPTRREQRQGYDAKRRRFGHTGLYQTKAWRQRRREQLEREPFCAMHRALGEYVAATVADHVVPHRGDAEAFLTGELQSLCAECHNSIKQMEERQAEKMADKRQADALLRRARAKARETG